MNARMALLMIVVSGALAAAACGTATSTADSGGAVLDASEIGNDSSLVDAGDAFHESCVPKDAGTLPDSGALPDSGFSLVDGGYQQLDGATSDVGMPEPDYCKDKVAGDTCEKGICTDLNSTYGTLHCVTACTNVGSSEGCADHQCCYPTYDKGACFWAGDRKDRVQCQSHVNCACGHLCLPMAEESSTCHKMCTQDADCECGGICWDTIIEGYKACIVTNPCCFKQAGDGCPGGYCEDDQRKQPLTCQKKCTSNGVTPECEADEMCYSFDTAHKTCGHCGTKAIGEACDWFQDCVCGAACITWDGITTDCKPMCKTASECPKDSTCEDTGYGYGLCKPLSADPCYQKKEGDDCGGGYQWCAYEPSGTMVCAKYCTTGIGSECWSGAACYPVGSHVACISSGTKVAGEACAHHAECTGGMTCLKMTGDAFQMCHTVCKVTGDCAAGTCKDTGGGYKVCAGG